MLPAAVAAAVTVMVPVAATPAPLSASTPIQSSVTLLLANHASAIRCSMEPRPASVTTWSALVTLTRVSAAWVPATSFWPIRSARYASRAGPCAACEESNSAVTKGTRRLLGTWLKEIDIGSLLARGLGGGQRDGDYVAIREATVPVARVGHLGPLVGERAHGLGIPDDHPGVFWFELHGSSWTT